MRGPKPRLHLPYGQWPAADRLLWERAMGSDDPFCRSSRRSLGQGLAALPICSHGGASSGSWRSTNPPHWKSLRRERLTVERIRSFVTHLAESQHSTIGREPGSWALSGRSSDDAGTRLDLA